jgi:aerobic-type carbon monoxide dehydrogenase small subunit (CoxS/CutS family)
VSSRCTITINGLPREVDAGISLAVVLLDAGVLAFRHDLQRSPRAPLCGMGSCFECRAAVDGLHDVRTCLVAAEDGMRVETAG